jgi:hypothetical protein
MKLVNCNPLGEIDLPLIGRTLAAGEEFEVDDDTATELLKQTGNFAPAQPAKGKTSTAQEG